MTNNNSNKFKKLVSKEKSGWLDKAKWHKENEEWLDISFKIAVKIISALKSNKADGQYPSNQKDLAEALECTPQYVSKLLKGKEKLGIDTITKIGKILGVKLIEVPNDKIVQKDILIPSELNTLTSYYLALNDFPLNIRKQRQEFISCNRYNRSKNSKILISKTQNDLVWDYEEDYKMSTYNKGKSHLKLVG